MFLGNFSHWSDSSVHPTSKLNKKVLSKHYGIGESAGPVVVKDFILYKCAIFTLKTTPKLGQTRANNLEMVSLYSKLYKMTYH